MAYTLMNLPFDKHALEPAISAETLEYHYGKHHQAYVNNLNALIKNTKFETMYLDEIIQQSDGAIFNNAAQVFNHDFYFQGMRQEKSEPSKELLELINRDFASLEAFKERFLATATTLFGSGWVWLALDESGNLLIESHANASNPLVNGHTPLLTCDVWEHAYYIDYRNARADYLKQWSKLINWEFVSQQLIDFNEKRSSHPNVCNDNDDLCNYIDTLEQTDHSNT